MATADGQLLVVLAVFDVAREHVVFCGKLLRSNWNIHEQHH